jgi:hypothetical protein
VSKSRVVWSGVLSALAALACPPATAAAGPPATLTADFTSEVVYSEGTGLMDFSGSLIVNEANLRIDLLLHQTDEQVRLLVDYGLGTLIVLYPDTLNGTSYELAGFDDAGGFVRIRDALLGRQPEPPAGWTSTAAESAELDGAACTRRSATGPDGALVEWWVGADGRPLKIDGRRGELRLSVSLSDYQQAGEVEELTFAVPEGYTVKASEGGRPEGLPRL